MERSCAYHTKVIPVPADLTAWVSRHLVQNFGGIKLTDIILRKGKTLPQREVGFQWVDSEEKVNISYAVTEGYGPLMRP